MEIEILGEILWQTFLIFVIGGCVVSLGIGLWMLFSPATTLRANDYLNKWISTRLMMRPLDMPRTTERFFYKHHRVVGILLLAGAAYTLYSIVFRYRQQALLKTFSLNINPHALSWLLDSAVVLLTLGSLFALVLGAFLLIRPSLLRNIEAWANKGYSGRRMTKFLDIMHYAPDRAVGASPRVFAVLIILGSLYVLVNAAFLLL